MFIPDSFLKFDGSQPIRYKYYYENEINQYIMIKLIFIVVFYVNILGKICFKSETL